MKKTNISTTKNNLSKLLDEVKNGETVLIVDRDRPIARLVPVAGEEASDGLLPGLARDGILTLPKEQLDVQDFLAGKKAPVISGASAVEAARAEREESQ